MAPQVLVSDLSSASGTSLFLLELGTTHPAVHSEAVASSRSSCLLAVRLANHTLQYMPKVVICCLPWRKRDYNRVASFSRPRSSRRTVSVPWGPNTGD